MNLLQPAAKAGVFATLITCAVVIAKSIPQFRKRWAEIDDALSAPPPLSFASISVFGCMLYAYSIGANVPAIIVEMQQPTTRRLLIASVCSSILCLALFIPLTLAVYLSFVGHVWEDGTVGTHSDFTQNY